MGIEHVRRAIISHFDKVESFLGGKVDDIFLPLYSSVDVRTNGIKSAVVDTNLFPAGFNNLCQFSTTHIPNIFKDIILNRVPSCKHILVLAENHTRNVWYWENMFVLKDFLETSGFDVKVAIMKEGLGFSGDSMRIETALSNSVDVYSLESVLSQCSEDYFDFILLNNDLTKGVPEVLKQVNVPIYPSYAAGWHSRIKTHHFQEVNILMKGLSDFIDFDPFYTSTDFVEINNVDINSDLDRRRLVDSADFLFDRLEKAYKKRQIDQKPLLFLKANRGTYGMGVVPIECSDDILEFNRRSRNKLSKGKESQEIREFILQEGVPSSLKVNDQVAELCLYFAEKQYLGGFYRLNSQKSDRENLNSRGMSFQKMCVKDDLRCPFSKDDNACGEELIQHFLYYKFLGLVSIYAAHQEIKVLEKTLV
ncbi:glutamate--cysteine ligase [Candidatus Marinamargulisbacteria bacterium SCGC AG-343-D04]|nr:glutamate--cysteine ligase [Candidatus Marinamargulisbacteria bacterium SCGC AG-343-D04]